MHYRIFYARLCCLRIIKLLQICYYLVQKRKVDRQMAEIRWNVNIF